jgi:hypothetical protein
MVKSRAANDAFTYCISILLCPVDIRLSTQGDVKRAGNKLLYPAIYSGIFRKQAYCYGKFLLNVKILELHRLLLAFIGRVGG